MMTRTQAGVREVLDKHDLLLSVGGDLFTWSLPSNINPWPPGLPLIHLDTDPWQIGKNYPAQVAILGDPKATLPDITAGVAARMSASAKSAAAARLKSTAEAIKKDREAFRAKARAMATKTPVQPLALLEAIGAMLPKDAVVIEEILSSAPGVRSMIDSDDERSAQSARVFEIGDVAAMHDVENAVGEYERTREPADSCKRSVGRRHLGDVATRYLRAIRRGHRRGSAA